MTIYLDYAASAPIRDEVLASYVEHLRELGNPSSVHSSGQNVRRVLEEARESLARSVDCDRSEIIFTSGGTESDNLAIKGIYWNRKTDNQDRNIIISAATEHHGVIDPIEWLEKQEGAKLIWVPVDQDGNLDYNWLDNFIETNHSQINLISLMWANNETGVITDIKRICEKANQYEIPVHSDAVAAFGHTPLSFRESGLSALSISAHKIGGPIGIGALIVSRATKLVSIIHGGGQERGMRSGTMNAPGARAFALAAELAIAEQPKEIERLRKLSQYLIQKVTELTPVALLTGNQEGRLANNVHFIFKGCSGESLLFLLDQKGISVSTGSACQAGVAGPSHVLVAMGRSTADATGCLRITIGHQTTLADLDALLAELPEAVEAALKAGLPNEGER